MGLTKREAEGLVDEQGVPQDAKLVHAIRRRAIARSITRISTPILIGLIAVLMAVQVIVYTQMPELGMNAGYAFFGVATLGYVVYHLVRDYGRKCAVCRANIDKTPRCPTCGARLDI